MLKEFKSLSKKYRFRPMFESNKSLSKRGTACYLRQEKDLNGVFFLFCLFFI